ncbi:hypothetical protein ASD79_00940 [Caulobacter sp. Root655]|nr:hypothetical protein ASD79_00940 [Caulobacter sp. Root655]
MSLNGHASIELLHASVWLPVFAQAQQISLFAGLAKTLSMGRIARNGGGALYVNPLNGVSLSINEGERVGLVGRNGAGKTTLLKLLAGVHHASSGRVQINGSVASLLEIGGGMDLERTGLQNIEYVTRLLGFDKRERARIRDEIVEFAELGQFIALPVRTYSAGMMTRLSFGLATARPKDILVLDEVIGAGDAFFIEKAGDRIRSLVQQARIMVLATHSADILVNFCNRAVWVDQGVIRADGDPAEVWHLYMNSEPA